MTSKLLVPDRRPSYLRDGSETFIDFRRRCQIDAEANRERRRLNVAEQTAELNVPGVRIRAWENVHSLRMPSSPEHPILQVIAFTTKLSIAEVLQEQLVRAANIAP